MDKPDYKEIEQLIAARYSPNLNTAPCISNFTMLYGSSKLSDIQLIAPEHTAEMKERLEKLSQELKQFMATQTPKPFEVDEKLLWHSPFTDTDIEVIYRGYYNGVAVCYDPKTGWQGLVPFEYLRREADNE